MNYGSIIVFHKSTLVIWRGLVISLSCLFCPWVSIPPSNLNNHFLAHYWAYSTKYYSLITPWATFICFPLLVELSLELHGSVSARFPCLVSSQITFVCSDPISDFEEIHAFKASVFSTLSFPAPFLAYRVQNHELESNPRPIEPYDAIKIYQLAL